MLYKLKQYFQEDQNDRGNKKLSATEMTRRDAQRRREVRRIILEQKLKAGADFYHAAFIFHHGPHKVDSQRAIHLAKKSMERGYKKARWLYAAAFDRFLMKNKKLQKFGTQFFKKKNGSWQLWPLDQETTDAERTLFGVKSLVRLKKQIERLNSSKSS